MLTRRELLQRFAGSIIGVSVGPAILETTGPIGYIGGARIGHLRANSPFTWDPVTRSLTLRYQRAVPTAPLLLKGHGQGTIVITRSAIHERDLYPALKDTA